MFEPTLYSEDKFTCCLPLFGNLVIIQLINCFTVHSIFLHWQLLRLVLPCG